MPEAPTCYGCGHRMVPMDAGKRMWRRPKHADDHELYVCPIGACAGDWANADLDGVVQCATCHYTWGQIP